jgi:hypothetical protein
MQSGPSSRSRVAARGSSALDRASILPGVPPLVAGGSPDRGLIEQMPARTWLLLILTTELRREGRYRVGSDRFGCRGLSWLRITDLRHPFPGSAAMTDRAASLPSRRKPFCRQFGPSLSFLSARFGTPQALCCRLGAVRRPRWASGAGRPGRGRALGWLQHSSRLERQAWAWSRGDESRDPCCLAHNGSLCPASRPVEARRPMQRRAVK